MQLHSYNIVLLCSFEGCETEGVDYLFIYFTLDTLLLHSDEQDDICRSKLVKKEKAPEQRVLNV